MFSGRDLVRFKGTDAVDLQDAEKMETTVHWSNRGEDDVGDTEDGTESGANPWNRLALVKFSNIGFSAFSVGLQRCDSAEF